jgi:Caspase domain
VRLKLLAVALLSMVAVGECRADKRVALVVGNSRYQNVAPLNNPGHDATLIADTLRSAGFSLVGNGARLDLDKPAFDKAVQTFGNQLVGADVALFYYSGHGFQVRGENYLAPVSANLVKESDVDFQMVDVGVVLRQMTGAGTKLNIVILDACRNNPFATASARGFDRGLAQIHGAEGTLISFATQPGNVAQDGDGSNSPFTDALAEAIRKPGLDVLQTFNQVGLKVMRTTSGSQIPWTSTSPIDGTFYFTATPENQLAVVQPPSDPPRPPPPASVPKAAPAAPSLDQLAIDFVNEDMKRSEGSAAEYLAHARRTTADQIDYYGQQTSRADVLKDKEKYVARWPIRSYRVRADTIRTSCETTASQCRINGLVDFNLSNPSNGKKTQGVSTFELGIRFEPDGGKLIYEQGKVLSARK